MYGTQTGKHIKCIPCTQLNCYRTDSWIMEVINTQVTGTQNGRKGEKEKKEEKENRKEKEEEKERKEE